MKISTIMPSYLGDYPGAASDRENKFRRAVISWFASSYTDKELIVVSDGCMKTVELFCSIFNVQIPPHFDAVAGRGVDSFSEVNAVLVRLPKQPGFSGAVRNAGLDAASGQVITYLDTDDKFLPGHLEAVAEAFKPNTLYEHHRWVPDWIYFDDYLAAFDINDHRQRNVSLQYGGVGTSNIAHRHGLSVRWTGGYGHDWLFIRELMDKYPNYRMAHGMKYLTCHLPNNLDV